MAEESGPSANTQRSSSARTGYSKRQNKPVNLQAVIQIWTQSEMTDKHNASVPSRKLPPQFLMGLSLSEQHNSQAEHSLFSERFLGQLERAIQLRWLYAGL